MKKFLLYTLGLIFILIIFLSQFGIQIGNIRIGKQLDFSPYQNYVIEQSNFYKSYYSTNKIICLNNWATWCEPCLEEIPALNKVKEYFNQNEIYFLSLSIDDDSIKLKKYLDTKQFHFNDITFDNVPFRNSILNLIEGKKSDAYISTKSVPNTYLIKNKRILKKFEGLVDTSELKSIILKNL